jgi:murein DD-endopeptidase MepM/ murein hydrolase activator NlpD
MPVGTPLLAMVGGVTRLVEGTLGGWQVYLEGDNGILYKYMHLSGRTEPGRVEAGQQIARSGGAPGAAGSGNSGGPHLHLSMLGTVNGPHDTTLNPRDYL